MLHIDQLHRVGLRPTSFTAAPGEIVAVRGPSGSGKTLLLRAIADLDPHEGTVTLDGQDRASMPAYRWRRLVGYVPAEPGWWADHVREHYADWNAALPLIEAMGLPATCADWAISRLSTGERQRLGLARALALRPRVLLLDEPTSGLDESAESAVEKVLLQQQLNGATILWVTHNPAQARRLTGRALLIDEGQVTEGRP